MKRKVRGMLEEKDCCAVDKVIPIFCGFMDRVSRYTKSAKINKEYAMYRSLIGTVLSGNCTRECTCEELKAVGPGVSEFKKKVMELRSSVRTSTVYKMKFHLLDHFVQEVRSFGNISVLDASNYEKLSVHIKRVCQGLSRRPATRIRETGMLMKRLRRDEQCTMISELRSNL